MIDLLILLLKPALLWESNPRRYWYLTPLALVAWIADMVAAHTTWALTAGWPQKGEWTISHTLERLCHPDNDEHEDYCLYVEIGFKINRLAPNGRHIKVLSL